jgi:putative spermidine/putrescine transport system substrate-binding protein
MIRHLASRWPLTSALMLSGLLALAGSPAQAIEPVGAAAFNVKTDLDLAALTRDNFEATVTAAVKPGGEVVFYDFADTLCEPLAAKAAEFAKATGVAVQHVCVDGDAATQQLIAAQQAGAKAPADLFFGPNGNMRALTQAGVIANIPLADLLPNAAGLDPEAARRSRGFEHGGTVLPFHRNQTVLAYNSANVDQVPQTLDELFAVAKAHDAKVAITNPTEGGSGSGFIESALLALAPECKDDLYNFGLTETEAKAVAARCMPAVIDYFRAQKPLITFTNGNEDSIKALVNNVVMFATVWEDDLYTLASKGLVQKTVRPFLLESGQVGDGDGLFVLASTTQLPAALLFANYLMSDDVQVAKMEQTGSRTARFDLQTAGKIPERLASFLLPDKEYHERTRPRINGLIADEASDLFVKQVIAQ